MMTFSRLSSLAVAATIAFPCSAQTVDYAALEATMGEPVTTSVTGSPQRASETPAAVVIISHDQISRSPARDIPGLLKTYAGIDVNRWTAGQTDVAVRGGVQTYNARLLVLVNGRQVYLDHYGMTDWNLLGVQLEEIQQIELVRGPSAALFGFNAASGVVNIITVDALSGAHIAASAGLGTHGYNRIGAAATIPLSNNVGMRISLGHQREDERAIPAAQLQVDAPTIRRDEANVSIEAAPDPRTRVAVEAGHSENRQLEFLPTQSPSIDSFRITTGGIRADRDTGWGSLSAHGYINRLHANYGIGGNPLILDNQTSVAQTSALVRLGLNNVLRVGAEYRNNRLDSPSAYSQRIDYKVFSGSSMLDLHLNDIVGLTFAARLDHLRLAQHGAPVEPVVNLPSDFDRSFNRLSLNAAALIQLADAGQIRINGGRGYQLPSLIDFGVHLISPIPGGLPLVIAGDPSIDPVPVWSAEVGYSRLIGDALSLRGTLFYTHTADVIGSPGGMPSVGFLMGKIPALVTRFAAAGDFQTYGTELSLQGKIGVHVKWRANYTFTHTDSNLAPPEQLAFSPERTTARHIANFDLRYNGNHWFSTTVLRYTSATQQFASYSTGFAGFAHVESAVAWDQKVGYRLAPNFMLTVAGENLTKAGGVAGSHIPADRRIRVALIFGK